ncbi:MAG: ABC transporter permease [Syntrophotaleaceae bacterium]
MDFLLESLLTAIEQIFALNPDVYNAAWTSIYTSSTAIILAAILGIPAGMLIGIGRYPGRRATVVILNTMMALPTVAVGLVIFGFLSRRGPLGFMGMLFTPYAMIIGQTILAAPIVAHYTLAALSSADNRIMPTALTLGASRFRASMTLLMEIRFAAMAAVIAGFGRIIAEVGIAIMLGGNIKGYTRTMTTAIALETAKGEFAFGLALGIILLSIALLVNLFLNVLQQR